MFRVVSLSCKCTSNKTRISLVISRLNTWSVLHDASAIYTITRWMRSSTFAPMGITFCFILYDYVDAENVVSMFTHQTEICTVCFINSVLEPHKNTVYRSRDIVVMNRNWQKLTETSYFPFPFPITITFTILKWSQVSKFMSMYGVHSVHSHLSTIW